MYHAYKIFTNINLYPDKSEIELHICQDVEETPYFAWFPENKPKLPLVIDGL